MNELRQRITCEACGKEIDVKEKETLEACPYCGSRAFHYWAKDNPVPMNFGTKPLEPKKVWIVLIYAAQRGTRTGKTYPVGKHIRGEIWDATAREVLYSRLPCVNTRNQLRYYASDAGKNEAHKKNWKIVGSRWAINKPKADLFDRK